MATSAIHLWQWEKRICEGRHGEGDVVPRVACREREDLEGGKERRDGERKKEGRTKGMLECYRALIVKSWY